jgi:hypothetical protein
VTGRLTDRVVLDPAARELIGRGASRYSTSFFMLGGTLSDVIFWSPAGFASTAGTAAALLS